MAKQKTVPVAASTRMIVWKGVYEAHPYWPEYNALYAYPELARNQNATAPRGAG